MISRGTAVALGLIGGWCLSLLLLALAPALPAGAALVAVLLRTQLQTGLFIVGHDAMHRSLVPASRGLNDGLGHLALALYACLPYGICRRNHLLHHRAPGSARDPDFHAPHRPGPVGWFLRFLGGYLGPRTLALLALLWLSAALLVSARHGHGLQVVLCYWILPLVLSAVQLFLFGTYLPHRRQSGDASHGAVTLAWPEPLSLLACFHFGYHVEHHSHPSLPWYALPACHRRLRRQAGALAVASQAL
ncbi:fatty acid desaturase [Cyanobium sp. CH-040]|uniref:fatty acid desaturase n=1 Tax=Cyanobium sp. CH-040 TaxID=2823708 RepID=UPI0020CF024D|nr:fatty acid desaturase [Cyanobium sp. CH-040]MCP9927505.1 fatty acid desaturase [Cyanobium sp. CH-040]